MIISPLKNNAPFAITIIISISLLLWIGTFFFIPTGYNGNNTNTINLIIPAFLQNSLNTYGSIFSFITILFAAFFINFLSIGQEIGSKSNFLPGFIFITLAFSNFQGNYSAIILLSNTFLIICFYFLLKTYKQEFVFSNLFISGLFLGLTCFFYIQYIFVFPVVLISLFILRPFYWREWIILLLGFCIPFYIYESICYLSNKNMGEILSVAKGVFSNFHLPFVSKFSLPLIIIIGVFICFSFLFSLTKGFGVKVKTQKVKYIYIWLLFFCIPIFFFNRDSDMPLYAGIFPLSVLIGNYLSEIKKIRIANVFLTIYFMSILIHFCHQLGAF